MLLRTSKINLNLVLKRRNNNYDLVRLLAAITVIVFHSFYLFKGNQKNNLNTPLMQVWLASGSLAVNVFFFLSGMFITASFIKSQNNLTFIITRLFRIWPALIICVLLTVLMGVLISTCSVKEYFEDRESWDYLIHGILLYHVRFRLPGVFQTNYYPWAVNGSLWTLPLEIICYLMIYILGVLGILKKVILTIIVYAIILILYYLNFFQLKDFLSAPFPFFIVGSLCYFFRQYIPLDYWVLTILVVLCFFFYNPFLLNVTLFYGIIVIGSSEMFKRVHLPGDYSYGVYIYGFVVQQLLAYYYPNMQPGKSVILVLPIVLLLSAFSWHFIELPAIKIGKKIALKPAMNHVCLTNNL